MSFSFPHLPQRLQKVQKQQTRTLTTAVPKRRKARENLGHRSSAKFKIKSTWGQMHLGNDSDSKEEGSIPGKVAGRSSQGTEHSSASAKARDGLFKGSDIPFSSEADTCKERQQTSGGPRTISSRDPKSRQGTTENPGSFGRDER